MNKAFKPLSSLLKASNVQHLLDKAQEHNNVLEIIQNFITQSNSVISKEDIFSCHIKGTELELSCLQASKATLIQYTTQSILHLLKQQHPDIFPTTLKKVKVTLNLSTSSQRG